MQGARRLPLRPLCAAVPLALSLALPLALASVPLDVRPRFTRALSLSRGLSLLLPLEALDLKSADPCTRGFEGNIYMFEGKPWLVKPSEGLEPTLYRAHWI